MASRTRCQVAGGIRREAGRAAPVVVNCSGLGARELAGECDLRPVFGQHVVVTNPGLDALFMSLARDRNGPASFRIPSGWCPAELHAGQVRPVRGGEQPQRVPPVAPGLADAVVGVKDDEVTAPGFEVMACGQAGLAAADHDGGKTVGVLLDSSFIAAVASPASASPRPHLAGSRWLEVK